MDRVALDDLRHRIVQANIRGDWRGAAELAAQLHDAEVAGAFPRADRGVPVVPSHPPGPLGEVVEELGDELVPRVPVAAPHDGEPKRLRGVLDPAASRS